MSDNYKDPKKDSPKQNELRNNSILKFNQFLSNDYHTYIVRKSEKLASALYVLTGFIPQDEPVRTKLRTCALDLVSQSSHSDSLGGKNAGHFGSRCAEIAAILETARRAGLISNMNADLICDEYANLATFVRDNEDRILERGGVLSNMMDVEPVKEGAYKRHSGVHRVSGDVLNIGRSLTSIVKGHLSRRDKILALYKNMSRISIKDAVSKIDGVSEKTVQRELLSLVSEGVLKKEGERRWSTYILVQSPVNVPPSIPTTSQPVPIGSDSGE